VRHDDHENKRYFRSPDRVFQINGDWYFATREGDQGPFASEAEVQREVERFICEKTELAHFQQACERKRRVQLTLAEDDRAPPEQLPSRDMPRRRQAQLVAAKRKVYI